MAETDESDDVAEEAPFDGWLEGRGPCVAFSWPGDDKVRVELPVGTFTGGHIMLPLPAACGERSLGAFVGLAGSGCGGTLRCLARIAYAESRAESASVASVAACESAGRQVADGAVAMESVVEFVSMTDGLGSAGFRSEVRGQEITHLYRE